MVSQDDDRALAQRHTLRVLALGQVLGGVGLAAGVAVGALLARQLLGGDALSGLPAALSTGGGALAAVPLSRLMARRGRRPGLALGYSFGMVGALTVVIAATVSSFVVLALGMAMFGAGNAASLLARYAGADLARPQQRGRAVSTVLFATTFGAVAGPNLIEPTGAVARAVGLPELAGPFLLSILAYAAAAAVISTALRPDPLLTARSYSDAPGPPHRGGSWPDVLRGPALVGLSTMVGAQFVMVSVMTMTPVQMRSHGHGLSVIGFVISIHVAGMYLFSPVTGLLCDRLGRLPTVQLGAATLLTAALLAGGASPASSAELTLALFLLGAGWSLCLVAGTTLLTDAVPLARRAHAQGNADLLVGLAGATGGVGSGLVMALSGFAVLSLVGAAIATAMLAAGTLARQGAGVPAAATQL